MGIVADTEGFQELITSHRSAITFFETPLIDAVEYRYHLDAAAALDTMRFAASRRWWTITVSDDDHTTVNSWREFGAREEVDRIANSVDIVTGWTVKVTPRGRA